MKKYELTLDQIQDIIYMYKAKFFCDNNCCGCYDERIPFRCELCNPELIKYLESITEDKSE